MKVREAMVGDEKYIRVNRSKAEKIWNRDKQFYVTALYERFPDAVYGSKDIVRRNASEDNFMDMVRRHILDKKFCNADVGEDLSFYVKESDLKQLEQEMERSSFTECEKTREERRKLVMNVYKIVLGNMVRSDVYEAVLLDKKGKPIVIPQKGGKTCVNYDGKNIEIPFLYRSSLGQSYNISVDKSGTLVDDRFIDNPMVLLKEPCLDSTKKRKALRGVVDNIVSGSIKLPSGDKVIIPELYGKIDKIVKEKDMSKIADKDEYVYMNGNVNETFKFKEGFACKVKFDDNSIERFIRSEWFGIMREARKEFLSYGKIATVFYIKDSLQRNKEREMKKNRNCFSTIQAYNKLIEFTDTLFTSKIIKLDAEDKPKRIKKNVK